MSDPVPVPDAVVRAVYDPTVLRASLARSRRASWISLVVGAVLAIWGVLDGNRPGMAPGWSSGVVFTAITAAVLLYLWWGRRAVYRLSTNGRTDVPVTALAVSPTGLTMSVGAEVPWAAINSVHLINLAARIALSPGYSLGQLVAPKMLSSIGMGRSHIFVLLRDGKAFADSLGDAALKKRVRMWRGTTPVPGDVIVLLDPIVPSDQVQSVIDALVVACKQHGVPLTDYVRANAALLGVASAAAENKA